MSGTVIKKFRKNDRILTQGELSREMYRMLSGKVALYTNYGTAGECLIQTLTAPDCFGEQALLTGRPNNLTAVACGNVAVLSIPEDALDDYIRGDYRRAVSLMRELAETTDFLSELVKEVGESHKAELLIILNRLRENRRMISGKRTAPEQGGSPERERGTTEKGTETKTAQPAREAGSEADVSAPAAPVPESVSAAAVLTPEPAAPAEGAAPAEQGEEAAPAADAARCMDLSAAEEDWPEEMDETAYTGLFPAGHEGYPGITHPEYGEFLFEKEYTCPHCRNTFRGSRVFYSHRKLTTTTHPEATRYELRIFYSGFEAEWYELITCPECYFTTLEDSFRTGRMLRRELYEQKLEWAGEEVRLDFDGERDLDFVFTQHYLALLCAPGFSDYRRVNAHLWMNLKWLYRGVGDREMAAMAEKQSLEAYQRVYKECPLTPEQEQGVCLMVANMLYQAGEIKEARKWAVRVRMGRGIGKVAYANLAEQLLGEIREAMEAEQEGA